MFSTGLSLKISTFDIPDFTFYVSYTKYRLPCDVFFFFYLNFYFIDFTLSASFVLIVFVFTGLSRSIPRWDSSDNVSVIPRVSSTPVSLFSVP